MNIENEVFKRSTILCDKLLPFGFKREKGIYVISRYILDNSFRIDVTVDDMNNISGKIYDLAFDEEYTNFRIEEQNGQFVSQVREEFIKFLEEIKDHCTNTNYFISSQANRIATLIEKEYGDKPEFPWDGDSSGVFRNPQNQKWYGLIMNINKKKLDKEDRDVEILNVKLDSLEIEKLLKCHGYYRAYHMNKKNWITIILDDTLTDEEIMDCVKKSHHFTVKATNWLIPANPKYYDVINCFNDTDIIFWKQSSNVNVGDLVYLYVAVPYSAILYCCQVLEVNIPHQYADDNLSMSKVMRLKLLNRFPQDKLTLDVLKSYGVKSIRGPRSMPKDLEKFIERSLKNKK